MSIEPDDLVAKYGAMSEADLLAVARGYDHLGEAAQGALRAEFARRGMEAPLVEEAGAPVDGRLVTVERYRDLSEAIVARSMLEAAGIRVFLFDENVVRLDWQISNMIGGIRVQVEDKDEAAARELLMAPVADSIELADGSEFEQPRCPVCGSAEITFEGKGRGAAMASWIVVGAPILPSGRETWVCSNCGTRWEETDEEATG
jgi:hypothetical protein